MSVWGKAWARPCDISGEKINNMDIVYLDTETTGFKPGQICQLSFIKETDHEVVACKNYYFNVDWVNPDASAVTGLTVERLKVLSNGVVFRDKADEIMNYLDNTTLVAHNLPFDENFISAELWRCDKQLTIAGRLDTMKYFNPITKIPAKYRKYGPYKNPKLSEVLDYFHVDIKAVETYNQELFGDASEDLNELHNSTFDTTAMYIVVNLQREKLDCGYGNWHRRFCTPVTISI